jgi:hypothetical protein
VVALASMVTWPLAAQPVLRERLWSIPQEGIGRPDVTGPIGRFDKDLDSPDPAEIGRTEANGAV